MPSDDKLLLDYALSTDPTPVPVSTAQVTSRVRVNISPSTSAQVYCDEIKIAVPVGSGPLSLFSSAPDGSVNTNTWAETTGAAQKGSDLWPGLDPDQDYVPLTFSCDVSDSLIDYNLVFGVFGAVNEAVGDVRIMIRESSRTDSTDPFTPKQGSLWLRKAYPDFYLKNLVAATPDAPTVPSTDFPNGAPIRLAWESNGTFFQLFMAGETTPVYSGTETTCTLEDGVSRDSTFVLAASMTGSPGQDTPQGGYQPIYLYESLTVSVSNPDLTPTSVTVSDTLDVTGTSTLGTTNTGALTSASATVSGALQAGSLATGGTLNVSGSATVGQATVTGELSVQGGSTLNGATVNGTLNGTGSASLNNLTVSGLSGSSGPVALLGTGVMLAQDTSIPQAGVEAHTDGFALAQVLIPSDVSKSSFAYGLINTVGTWFQVQGGTVGSFGSAWSDVMAFNPNAITVPIQAGTQWWYTAGNCNGNQQDSPIQIWWFPMGSNPSGEQTFRILSSEELADAPPPPVTPSFNAFVAREEQVAAAAADFVDRLAEALEASLADGTRADLARLLHQL
ncbi:hypothetical protein ABT010_33320 [Streptomyces sp. NPDC002668]|uniref:hypothetical protein n=1 Tax=Streptomyces sp. NPDC002668 TaxID=3154422 RepID=UPI0033172EC7